VFANLSIFSLLSVRNLKYLFPIRIDEFSYNLAEALQRTRPPHVCVYEFYTINRNYRTEVQTSGRVNIVLRYLPLSSEVVPSNCVRLPGTFTSGYWADLPFFIIYILMLCNLRSLQPFAHNKCSNFILGSQFSATKTGFCSIQIPF
jgi:hypothetical protein